MADPARIASLTAALADALAANTTTVAWRTLAAEASARGFPTARAFREWCQRTGVTIREAGGVALVAVPARAAWGGAEVRSAAPRASIGAMHAANHPRTLHLCENVWQVDPAAVYVSDQCADIAAKIRARGTEGT